MHLMGEAGAADAQIVRHRLELSSRRGERSTMSKSNAAVEKQGLVVVRNRAERFFFRAFVFIIPGIYILRAVLQYIDLRRFPYALLDFVKIPTEIALIIALAFSNLLFSTLAHTIYLLFSSKVIWAHSK